MFGKMFLVTGEALMQLFGVKLCSFVWLAAEQHSQQDYVRYIQKCLNTSLRADNFHQ